MNIHSLFEKFALLAIVGCLLLTVVSPSFVRGQSESTSPPSFEVVSVKPASHDEGEGGYKFEAGGRFVDRAARLIDLVLLAWHVRDFEVQGGPDWLEKDSVRFDIDATATGNPTMDRSRLMLRSLLEDRFHLIAHIQTSIQPLYELRRIGRPGNGLTPTKPGSCTPAAPLLQVPAPPSPAGATAACGFKSRLMKLDAGGTAMQFEWRGLPISSVARTLGTELYRQVNDETGLSGNYDVTLEFRPDNFSIRTGPVPGAAESTAPSIFTAVQDQLGMKLVSVNGPAQVLIIDHADLPAPN